MSKIPELGRLFKLAKDAYKVQEEVLDQLSKAKSSAEKDLLDAMMEEGMLSTRIDGLGLIFTQETNILNVKADNKETFFGYLSAIGSSGILKLDINPRTLTTWLRGHLDTLTTDKADKLGYQTASTKEEKLAILTAAEKESIEFLNSRGVNYFKKLEVRLKEEK